MSTEKKRYIEYDIMRILACFCVIMIHCPIFDQGNYYEYTSFEFQSINLWGVLSRWAVPVFVMLSGMMILPHGDETSISRLIVRRVLKMLVAYVGWSCVYSFYNTYILGIVYAPTKLKTFIDGCFSGEIHMWYLPMLAGLYIISPLLATLVKKIDENWIKYWLVGLFVFSSLIPFIVKLDIKFVSTIINSINGYMDLQFLGGWTLYFVLGHYIQQHQFTKRQKVSVYLCSIIALAFSLWGTVIYYMNNGEALGILSYEYPNIIIFSIGVLTFFKEEVSRWDISSSIEKKIYGVSKLTFGIYLIHVLLLKIWYTVGINIQMLHPVISIPVVALIVFASGAVIIWFFRKIPIIGTYLA